MKNIVIIFIFLTLLLNSSLSQEISDSNRMEISNILESLEDKSIVAQDEKYTVRIPDFISEDSLLNSYLKKGYTITQNPIVGEKVVAKNRKILIHLLITDTIGITTSGSFNLKVKPKLTIPQFVSPSCGGGRNDLWIIPELTKYPNNEVKVYNRWGNLVYKKKNFKSWDGRSNLIKEKTEESSLIPSGTYYYIIDIGEKEVEPYVGYMQMKR